MSRGLFISLEGGEGSGKSTQIKRLNNYLTSKGYEVVITRDPGGTPVAEAIRNILLNPEYNISPRTEAFLFQAARSSLVPWINRKLDEGKIVIADRFTDSTRVYQGIAGGMKENELETLISLATNGLEPDLTLVLDGNVKSLERARKRMIKSGDKNTRIDNKEQEFHNKVYDGFRRLARIYSERIILIPEGTVEDVHKYIVSAVEEKL